MQDATPLDPPNDDDVVVANEAIEAFHVRREDQKKARRVRQALGFAAPPGNPIGSLPIVVADGIKKNRMRVAKADGDYVFEINLKNRQIRQL